MNILLLLPVVFPLLAAVTGYIISKQSGKGSRTFFLASYAAEFLLTVIAAVVSLKNGYMSLSLSGIAGMGFTFAGDAFRVLYSVIAAFLWMMTGLFSKEYLGHHKGTEVFHVFTLITLCGVMGVFSSDDLFTCFCFFELMSFASYPLVVFEKNPKAMSAGATYLGVAIISGMLLLVGIFFLGREAGTLSYEGLRAYFTVNTLSPLGFAGGLLVLLGFGAKAGMYPLHIWLPKAHPVAPAPSSALLSGILTKTGVFGIIVLSADVFVGNKAFGLILLILAVLTMFWGAFLALFSVDLKRTLACSSMSQIGFILVGVCFSLLLGKEGGLAEAGTLLHMANHSLIKLVLFMCAGVAAMNLGSLDLNTLRGFGRKKPFFMVIFLIGALGIMGVPLLNGYISKTMIHEAITEYIAAAGMTGGQLLFYKGVEWIFLLSGGMTVAYMTKLFVCLFVEKNTDCARQKQYDEKICYLSPLSKAALAGSAVLLPFIGLFPRFVAGEILSPAAEFFGVEPMAHMPAFFGLESLKGAGISIAIGAFLYLVPVRRWMSREHQFLDLWNPRFDLEKLVYRPLLVQWPRLFAERVLSKVSVAAEWLLTRGVLLFICFVVRYISMLFDLVVLLLCKTALKPYVYAYREESLSYRFGVFLEKLFPSKKNMGEKTQSFAETVGETMKTEYNSFSFAFAMISLGLMIVLLFAVFGK